MSFYRRHVKKDVLSAHSIHLKNLFGIKLKMTSNIIRAVAASVLILICVFSFSYEGGFVATAIDFFSVKEAREADILSAGDENNQVELLDESLSLNVSAERGVMFDFNSLPQTLSAFARVPDIQIRRKVELSVTWNITEEAIGKASRSETFSLTGTLENAFYDGKKYGIKNPLSPTITVKFTDRRSVSATLYMRPIYKTDNNKLLMISCIAEFPDHFNFKDVTAISFEYSFGDEWKSLPIHDECREITPDSTCELQFDITTADFEPFDYDLVLPDDEFVRIVTDLIHIRFKITGGIFEGYTNSITFEGEKSAINSPDGTDNGTDGEIPGGFLPSASIDGSRGGGTSFWTTAGGTALAVCLGIFGAALCFAVGSIVGIALYRKTKRINNSA